MSDVSETGERGDSPNETQSVIDVATAAAAPVELKPGGIYTQVVPAGKIAHTINLDTAEYRDRPRRKTGLRTVHDAASFIAWLDKHAIEQETEIYCDSPGQTIMAVINPGSADAPGWGDYRLHLHLSLTPVWHVWSQASGRLLSQAEFAEHVELRRPDFVAPTGAEMLELAQSFQANRSVRFESSQRLKSGETQLKYVEDMEAKAGRRGDIAIPDRFSLALVPFEGATPYRVNALLRYRIDSGALRIGYVLERPEDVLADAFNAIRAEIEQFAPASVPVFNGFA